MNDPAFEADLRATVRPLMQRWGMPSLAIALVGPGREALVSESLASDATEPSWFSVASLGKHLTAWAVLRLAEQSRIDLGKPVGVYLPGLPGHWATPTVEQLLHHTSGLPEYLTPETVGKIPATREGFIEAYQDLPLAFAPGQAWIYTNTNYILLGMLVAEVSGSSYGNYLHQALASVGVSGVAVASPEWVVATNAAFDHQQAANIKAPVDTALHTETDTDSRQREVIGDGDIAFTAHGALQWLLALTDGRLLRPAMQNVFFKPYTLASGRLSCYAPGWFTEPLKGQWFAHHAGHFNGWTAMGIVHPAQRTGVIAMCNHAPGHTRFIRYLAQMALERFAPGSTPLSLAPIDPQDRAFEQQFRSQFLRPLGKESDPAQFANELRLVTEHGSPVRTVPNLWNAQEQATISVVEDVSLLGSRFRRMRLTYPHRVEHFLVGTTPQDQIHWAWGL